MKSDNLVYMANRIAEFFESMPDRPEAIEGVTLHLRRYWEPRMRRGLLEHAQASGDADLHPLVAEAARRLRLQ